MENLYCAWSLLVWDNSNALTFGQPQTGKKIQNVKIQPKTANSHRAHVQNLRIIQKNKPDSVNDYASSVEIAALYVWTHKKKI